MKINYDVIVSGAGPAGCTCAYFLAREGLRVLLLEKRKIPREKLCAGGVPGRVFNLLPIESFKERCISLKKYILSFGLTKTAAGEFSEGNLYSVERDKFDACLAELAKVAGADLAEECNLIGVEDFGKYVTVTTKDNKAYSAYYLAASDGGFSTVAEQFGFFSKDESCFGTCGFFRLYAGVEALEKYRHTVHLDFNFIPGGVAGIVPKTDYLWTGIYCGRKAKFAEMGSAALKFAGMLGITGTHDGFRGMFIPLYRKKNNPVKGRVLLLGEAARLVNPLSGDGILPAVQSGIIASEVIIKALGQNENIDEYSRRIYEEIGREMLIAQKFEKIAYIFPDIAYEGLVKIGSEALGTLNGTLSYQNFYERLKRKINMKITQALLLK